MDELTGLTIAGARELLTNGGLSARELAQEHITAVSQAAVLNAVITETPEVALEMAEASDARRANGKVGALEGIPLMIKDIFCTRDVLTTAGSHILEGFKPPYESTVSANLWNAGGVMLGKSNMDEFAMGSSNETSYYGAVQNPWRRRDNDQALVPGGSSGGSAAAVAGRFAMAATATDTGGSIRQPAAFTGTVGCKPTYGRCSRWGIVAFASSLDQAGPITRNVRDNAIMLGVMASHDPKDSTSAKVSIPNFESAITGDIRGLKIGIPIEYVLDGMPPEIELLWEKGIGWLKDAGAEIFDISLPHTKYALPAYYIVAPAEASSNLSRYDGVRFGLRESGGDLNEMYKNTRAAGFGKEVRRRILIGTYVLSAGYYDAYYLKAQKVRRQIANDFREVYKNVDAILTPSAPSAAFPFGEKADDPIGMYLNDVFTVPANLAGLPGISIPAGLTKDGLPLGLQVLASAFDEETMYRVAGVIEDAACFTAEPERWWWSGS